MSKEREVKAQSGIGMAFVTIVIALICIGSIVRVVVDLIFVQDISLEAMPFVALSVVSFIVMMFSLRGFYVINPGMARVLLLFGKYVGTVNASGFYWSNPFYSDSISGTHSIISKRTRTCTIDTLKVNDKMGNPIEIATVIVWHVADAAKALFDVENYSDYVTMQAETALRHVASIYAYDHMEDDDANNTSITLRSNIEEVSESLRQELDKKLDKAGITVDDARLTHLAYAAEIAPAMLRRQQAEAIISARKKIVEGAVGMVDMALQQLSDGGVVSFDEDKKAQMASNLMVVLCGESEAQPIVNTSQLN